MKKPKDIGRFNSKSEAINAGINPVEFRTAYVSETMGPHYKPILWVNNVPFVRK